MKRFQEKHEKYQKYLRMKAMCQDLEIENKCFVNKMRVPIEQVDPNFSELSSEDDSSIYWSDDDENYSISESDSELFEDSSNSDSSEESSESDSE